MKKKILRKLRKITSELIGEEQTNKIINEQIENVLDETKPVKETKKNKKAKISLLVGWVNLKKKKKGKYK